MRFALMIEPQQGLTYGQQVAIAKRAEANGFETLFRSDHYASFPGPGAMPTTDAWTVLAGLARDTDRIGLGALVSPVTFRHPGSFAKVVTTVDEMSGGRVEVGVGAGWNDLEHRQLGLDFPPIEARGPTCSRISWRSCTGCGASRMAGRTTGKVVSIREAVFHPKPVALPSRPLGPNGAARPRIICGGGGSPRGLRLAARYADEQNLSSKGPAESQAIFARLDEACRAIGRDPATITRSAMVGTLVGATEADVRARETAFLAAFGDDIEDGEGWIEERRKRWIVGTPGHARDQVRAYAAAGVERLMLQDFIPWDLDHIDAMGEALIGQV